MEVEKPAVMPAVRISPPTLTPEQVMADRKQFIASQIGKMFPTVEGGRLVILEKTKEAQMHMVLDQLYLSALDGPESVDVQKLKRLASPDAEPYMTLSLAVFVKAIWNGTGYADTDTHDMNLLRTELLGVDHSVVNQYLARKADKTIRDLLNRITDETERKARKMGDMNFRAVYRTASVRNWRGDTDSVECDSGRVFAGSRGQFRK